MEDVVVISSARDPQIPTLGIDYSLAVAAK